MRNKKMYGALAMSLAVALVPVYASAQDYKARTVEVAPAVERVKATGVRAIEKIVPVRAPRGKQNIEAIVKRFEAAILRLETLAARIKERANLFEERGVRINDVTAKLDAADILIAQAKTELREVSASVEALLASETPRNNLAAVREAILKLQETIKQAHAALVEAITILKRNS